MRNALPGVAAVACLLLALCAGGCHGVGGGSEGEIPVTTDSEQARRMYLQGRDLADKLRFTDSRIHFLDALAEDDSFALAHLALANSAPTTGEYYESLGRAVGSIDGVSGGERDMILAADAGAKGNRAEQLTHLLGLVEAYPNDERAHTLLGNSYFNRQQFHEAIAEFERAVEINPEFSSPYNGLGYCLRGLGRYAEAEKAFKKYIELIPDEPNPHDSYADLLMKMGRFEESIDAYEKALSLNPNFIGSHVGIGNNYMFLDQPERARESFRKLLEIARNDAERRQALLWMAASSVHEGDCEHALDPIRARAKIAEEGGDSAAVSNDHVLMGDILLHAGQPEEALSHYRNAVKIMETADVPREVKENTRRNQLYTRAKVALALDDIQTARELAESYGERASVQQDPADLRRHHELLGRIALREGSFDLALAELAQADQQNPVVLVLTAEAWKGSGDEQKSRELLKLAADFNALEFNYAFVRPKVRAILEETRP